MDIHSLCVQLGDIFLDDNREVHVRRQGEILDGESDVHRPKEDVSTSNHSESPLTCGASIRQLRTGNPPTFVVSQRLAVRASYPW